MNLTSSKTIKELLQKHGAKPSKTMGQNFLIDGNILDKIIEAADIQPTETIIEVGPGIGTLTRALASKAKKVIAIEKDPAMLEILKETLADIDNVQVILGNILEAAIPIPKEYKVVANVPYYITSPIIRLFLEAKIQPKAMILMIQKEVAQRICAKPPEMSLLAVSVQFYAEPKIAWPVSRGCFWPAPNVDSAIIKIVPKDLAAQVGKFPISSERFFAVAKAGFLHPRKKLSSNLAEGLGKEKVQTEDWLQKAGISPGQRAETLTLTNWLYLASLN
jgi:16S rRNA (adenine1518-N6/adenine1519-N6)-dimethyltransferase